MKTKREELMDKWLDEPTQENFDAVVDEIKKEKEASSPPLPTADETQTKYL